MRRSPAGAAVGPPPVGADAQRMRGFPGGLLRCACPLVLAVGAGLAAAEPWVITAFGPFAGRGKNVSATLLRSIERERLIADAECHHLPVEWDAVRAFVDGKLAGRKLRGVIGLGEGFTGRVAIEMVGRNAARGIDAAGVARRGEPIAPGAEASIRSRLIHPADAAPASRLPWAVSDDAGAYLCNFALFHYNRLAVPTSGFIHVPPQGNAADADYIATVRPLVLRILRLNGADGPAPP